MLLSTFTTTLSTYLLLNRRHIGILVPLLPAALWILGQAMTDVSNSIKYFINLLFYGDYFLLVCIDFLLFSVDDVDLKIL